MDIKLPLMLKYIYLFIYFSQNDILMLNLTGITKKGEKQSKENGDR